MCSLSRPKYLSSTNLLSSQSPGYYDKAFSMSWVLLRLSAHRIIKLTCNKSHTPSIAGMTKQKYKYGHTDELQWVQVHSGKDCRFLAPFRACALWLVDTKNICEKSDFHNWLVLRVLRFWAFCDASYFFRKCYFLQKKTCDICEKWLLLHPINRAKYERVFRKSRKLEDEQNHLRNFQRPHLANNQQLDIHEDVKTLAFDIEKSCHLRKFREEKRKNVNNRGIVETTQKGKNNRMPIKRTVPDSFHYNKD